MPDVYAKPSDVAQRWRPLSHDEEIKAAVLIEDASLRLRRRFPTLEARLTAGGLDPREVTAVVAGMVKRAMVTGGAEGVTQESETTGPFASSFQYANPMGNLYLTADDVSILADPAASRRVFSVDLTPRY